jgi:antitoxin (DNA-binding transcriptional repressor) of toxin-antitoxin stability system
MDERSAYAPCGHTNLASFRPIVPLRRRGRFLFLLLRRLTATTRRWWSADADSLRAIAAIEAARIDQLSETGRLLRRQARQQGARAPRRHS